MSASLKEARTAVSYQAASVPLVPIRQTDLPRRFVLPRWVKGTFQITDQPPFRCFDENRRTIRASYGHDVCEGRKALNGSGPPEAKGG